MYWLKKHFKKSVDIYDGKLKQQYTEGNFSNK